MNAMTTAATRREPSARSFAPAPPSAGRLALACTGWITLACVTLLPAASAPRVLVSAAFVSLVPGAALLAPCRRVLARHGRPLTGGEAAVLTVALSLSLCAIVSELFFLATAFTMPRCVIALAVLTSVAALWPTRRATTTAAAPSAPSAPSGTPTTRSPLSER